MQEKGSVAESIWHTAQLTRLSLAVSFYGVSIEKISDNFIFPIFLSECLGRNGRTDN